jgi:VWFA-related protein
VDVLVTADGRPVAGLGADDFELFDSGVRQRVDLVDSSDMPLNIVFVFDFSESVAGEPLSHLVSASRAVLEGLRTGDRVALVGFSESVRQEAGLSTDHRRVAAALEQGRPNGDTSWVDAAFAGLMVAESEPGRSLVLVFSDGVDTSSWLAPDVATGIARRTGVVVYGVSAGAGRKPDDLAGLADATGGRLVAVDTTKVLRGTFLQILDEFRHRYILAFTPRGVSPSGWHALEVRLKSKRGAVKARPGYFGTARGAGRDPADR